jgi:lysophospholipid acyltransferase (LPLAT)-like uncharacterized protein
VFLAQKSGSPIIWVDVSYSRFWELKSWDRFRIPKPFSRVEITLHPMGTLPPEMDAAAFESSRLRLETQMTSGAKAPDGRPMAVAS